MKTLLNLSGGIDSAYCLYKYAESKIPLLIHHCNLYSWEGRVDLEKRAVLKQLNWIKKNLPFNYKYYVLI